MRILLSEVVVKRRVGEVLEARGIVGHGVDRSWEVGDLVAVAVFSLVLAGDVAQVSGGAITGSCSFL